MTKPDWSTMADTCLLASAPNSELARLISKPFMPREDYPTVGTLISFAVANGNIGEAFLLVEHLFPGWGVQVGRPLTARRPCGWYACIFRESSALLDGMYGQDSRAVKPSRYAAEPALAIVAALCRVLADFEPGTSAIRG